MVDVDWLLEPRLACKSSQDLVSGVAQYFGLITNLNNNLLASSDGIDHIASVEFYRSLQIRFLLFACSHSLKLHSPCSAWLRASKITSTQSLRDRFIRYLPDIVALDMNKSDVLLVCQILSTSTFVQKEVMNLISFGHNI